MSLLLEFCGGTVAALRNNVEVLLSSLPLYPKCHSPPYVLDLSARGPFRCPSSGLSLLAFLTLSAHFC